MALIPISGVGPTDTTSLCSVPSVQVNPSESRQTPDQMGGIMRPYDYTTLKISSLDLKILTFNTSFFKQFPKSPMLNARTGFAARSDEIIKMIVSESPDIVLLQDGEDNVDLSDHIDKGEFIATITKMCDQLSMLPVFHSHHGTSEPTNHVTMYNDRKLFYQPSRLYAHNILDKIGNGFGRLSTVTYFSLKSPLQRKSFIPADPLGYQVPAFAIVGHPQRTQVTIEELIQ